MGPPLNGGVRYRISYCFYCNIFCILFDIKNSIYFVLWDFLCVMWDICMCRCVWHLYSSVWVVTKHGGRSLSPTGVNWVSDGVGIDSTEYMHCKDVRFSGSLKWTTVIDFWGRNRVIPVRTKLLLLSNRLQGFQWDRAILNWDFSVHAVVTTCSASVTKGFGIFMDQKLVPTGLWKGKPNAAVM